MRPVYDKLRGVGGDYRHQKVKLRCVEVNATLGKLNISDNSIFGRLRENL